MESELDEGEKGRLPPNSSRDLCKSLPNLSIGRASQNSSPLSDIVETKSHDDKCLFSSHADLRPPDSTPDPNSFTLRRLSRVNRLPPPLDLSRVNERYEELERSRSSLVHVALIRNYNCPLEGRPVVVRDECCSSDENREESSQDGCSKERRRSVEKISRSYDDDSSLVNPLRNESFDRDSELSGRRVVEEEGRIASNLDRCLDGRKKGGRKVVVGNSIEEEEEEESWKKFLTAMDELQSPQLVNDCKNSMMDSRRVGEGGRGGETFEEEERRPPPPPLSKSVNSTNGGQAGNGSTLPSVYGPIPYSQ